jgi:protein gp37
MLLSELNLEQIIADHYPEFTGIHPACTAVPQCNEEEFARLVDSIKQNGLNEPILRTRRHELLDGRTRLLACYVAGQDIRVETDAGIVDPWVTSKTKNIDRRHLDVGQIAYFGSAWLEHERAEAKKRQQEHGGTAPGKQNTSGNISTSDLGKSRDKVGDRLGISGRSVDKMSAIKEFAPDKAIEVRDGKTNLETAYKEARQRKEAIKPMLEQQGSKRPDASTMTQIFSPSGSSREIPLPGKVVFNHTNDSVDWARWTWNPVTGCEHGCKFCYAREIANSERMAAFYPNKFEPTFHPYRLEAPRNTKKPESEDARDGRVFVCSMADLFGKWVPKEWISQVFESCIASPEWTYLFLTKWPARYSQMPLIDGAWYGASVVQQSDVSRIESDMQKFSDQNVVRWISMEPMLEKIRFSDLSWCNLVVIGSQTSTNQPDGFVPEFSPEFDWVVDVVNQCREFGVPYYLKANLGPERPGMNLPKMEPR